MLKRCISKDWLFLAGGQVKNIDLPHDYAISKTRRPDVSGGACNGFFPDSREVYVKHLNLKNVFRGLSERKLYCEAPPRIHAVFDRPRLFCDRKHK